MVSGEAGPGSAGAHPGPLCYRHGGPLTVTDANLLLGKIQPAHFPAIFGPDGRQPLDAEAVGAAFDRLAAAVFMREVLVPGTLLSYGPDTLEIVRRATVYVDRILRGEKPGELPVEQPTKFQFVINLKTADALGLTIPPLLLN